MTRRRWIATTFNAQTATLTGSQAEHLVRVLRATVGMRADVVAGDRVYSAVIDQVSDSQVRFQLEEELSSVASASAPIDLMLAVFKFDRLEWALEKATELGVSSIVPVLARRTEKHLAQAAATRVERWRRIAREAAQQSRGSFIPRIDDPQPLSAGIQRAGDIRILLSEHETARTLTDCLRQAHQHMPAATAVPSITLAVGPEGGWTGEEAAAFAKSGWQPATLGPRILRAETAILASLAIVQSLMMDATPAAPDQTLPGIRLPDANS